MKTITKVTIEGKRQAGPGSGGRLYSGGFTTLALVTDSDREWAYELVRRGGTIVRFWAVELNDAGVPIGTIEADGTRRPREIPGSDPVAGTSSVYETSVPAPATLPKINDHVRVGQKCGSRSLQIGRVTAIELIDVDPELEPAWAFVDVKFRDGFTRSFHSSELEVIEPRSGGVPVDDELPVTESEVALESALAHGPLSAPLGAARFSVPDDHPAEPGPEMIAAAATDEDGFPAGSSVSGSRRQQVRRLVAAFVADAWTARLDGIVRVEADPELNGDVRIHFPAGSGAYWRSETYKAALALWADDFGWDVRVDEAGAVFTAQFAEEPDMTPTAPPPLRTFPTPDQRRAAARSLEPVRVDLDAPEGSPVTRI